MNSMIPDGMLVLLRRPRYSIMSSVCSPTDTAAYSEYGVNLYSWMCSGRQTGCNNRHIHRLAVWCSGNVLILINAVALHQARLVTAFGHVNCLIT